MVFAFTYITLLLLWYYSNETGHLVLQLKFSMFISLLHNCYGAQLGFKLGTRHVLVLLDL